MHRYSIPGLLAASLLVLAGCTTTGDKKAAPGGSIHEIYSHGIRKAGFTHEVRLVRENTRHFDVITVHIPLDALRRRHDSLERVLKSIGEIAAAHNLPTLIDVQAEEEEDLEFVQARLMGYVGRSPNVQMHFIANRPQTRIVVMVSRPPQTADFQQGMQ
jgi:hypothetical protein